MTAEEFYRTHESDDSIILMIEFAKLHVKAALKAKIEAMQEHMNGGYSLDEIDSFTDNAYPLDKII
jgi:hypothetical protein